MPTPLSKKDAPAVASYADHDVITPPNPLRNVVSRVEQIDIDPIKRAEQALAELSSEFSMWMQQECDRLEAAHRQVVAAGFNSPARDALFHAAHDIKGQAATFGYPAVAPAAESLCRLIEHSPDLARVPLRLVKQHVDAIRAMIRENGRADAQELAATLTLRLREVTDEFLIRENRDRPEHIEAILGPTLLSSSDAAR